MLLSKLSQSIFWCVQTYINRLADIVIELLINIISDILDFSLIIY